MDNNRTSDLTDPRRNSFGFKVPSNSFILGTKGDVETFFLLLNDLISNGILEDYYSTISHDLYRTLVNLGNLERFKSETSELKDEFANISSDQINWEKYPFNRECGLFDYQQQRIDTSKSNLFDVFENFFISLEKAPFWIEESLSRNGKYSRLIVSPTEIHTSRKFKKYNDIDFLEAADDPLWLREPG